MYERYRKGLYWIGDECYKVLALSMIRKAEVSGCIYLCLILYFLFVTMEKNGFELKVMHFKQQLLIFSCYQWKTRLWKNTFISAIVTIKCQRRMDTERKGEQKQKKDKSGSEERILLDFSHSKWETEFAVRSDCHLVITVPNKEWSLWLCHSTKLLKAASRRQAELDRMWVTSSAEHHLYHFITYISYPSDDDSLVPLVLLLFWSQGTDFQLFLRQLLQELEAVHWT